MQAFEQTKEMTFSQRDKGMNSEDSGTMQLHVSREGTRTSAYDREMCFLEHFYEKYVNPSGFPHQLRTRFDAFRLLMLTRPGIPQQKFRIRGATARTTAPLTSVISIEKHRNSTSARTLCILILHNNPATRFCSLAFITIASCSRLNPRQ